MRYRDLEHRLMANSTVCEETGCWVWTGAVSDDGYGRLTMRVPVVAKRHRKKSTTVKPKTQPRGFWAHRVAYECLMAVKLSEDETVDHNCPMGPNKRCINPEHLRVVSRAVNTALQWARRRARERGEPLHF